MSILRKNMTKTNKITQKFNSKLIFWVMYVYYFLLFGAGEGTRTPTSKTLDPKSSASANSATPAILKW